MSKPSIGAMLRQMAGMVGTKDLSDWEQRFLTQVLRSTGEGKRTSILTGDQLEKVDEIWTKHFAPPAAPR